MAGENFIEVDISGVCKRLEEYAANGDNASLVHKQLGEILSRYVNNKFQAQGPGWAPLSPATIARRRKSRDYMILTDAGILAGSMVAEGGPDSAEVSTNVTYSVFHLQDSSHQAKRDFFDIDFDAALEECADDILEYLTR